MGVLDEMEMIQYLEKIYSLLQDNVTLKGVLITAGICIVAYGIYYFGKSLNTDNLKRHADIHVSATEANIDSTNIQEVS